MRRKISLILSLEIVFILFVSSAFNSFAQDTPSIKAISFNNAVIDGSFKSEVYQYGLTLVDSSVTPTLKSYEINGEANIFVNYIYDESNHPVGITATLEFDTGSLIYNFSYTNPAEYSVNSNNLLSSLQCSYGELVPQLNDSDISYKLYIPKDLTQIKIIPVPQDINAYASPVELTLNDAQTPEIKISCVASDGSRRDYSFNIKRVDKTLEQVKTEMEQPDYKSFVDGTFIYQKPEFLICVCAVLGGAAVLLLLWRITRRILVNPYDSDEKPFYSPIE